MSEGLTALLERVPVEEISETAERITPGRVVAALIATPLFVAGWLLAKSAAVAWFAARWVFGCALVGWKHARGEAMLGPDPARLMKENEMLRAELQRDDLTSLRAENDQLRAELQRLRRLM